MLCAINPNIYSEVEKLSLLFRTAIPFPHVVIDNFLDESVANGLLKDFPEVSIMHRSHHYLFSNKYELSSWHKISNSFNVVYKELISKKFQLLINKISGENLFVDSKFYGDIHQGVNGSFLDMHTDFNVHPYHINWLHRLNVLIYLNKNWAGGYGGELRLGWGGDGAITEIPPLFNRCVIMLSDDTTYHGYNRMTLPKGVTRKSILTHFYKEESSNRVPHRKLTTWVPSQTSILKSRVAKLYNPVASLKRQIFG